MRRTQPGLGDRAAATNHRCVDTFRTAHRLCADATPGPGGAGEGTNRWLWCPRIVWRSAFPIILALPFCGSGIADPRLPGQRAELLIGRWAEEDVWDGQDREHGSRGESEKIALELHPDGRAFLTCIRYWAPADENTIVEAGRWGTDGDDLRMWLYGAGNVAFGFRRDGEELSLWRADGTQYRLQYGFLPVETGTPLALLVGTWRARGLSRAIRFAADGSAQRYEADLVWSAIWSASDTWITVSNPAQGYNETWRYEVNADGLVLADPYAALQYVREAE